MGVQGWRLTAVGNGHLSILRLRPIARSTSSRRGRNLRHRTPGRPRSARSTGPRSRRRWCTARSTCPSRRTPSSWCHRQASARSACPRRARTPRGSSDLRDASGRGPRRTPLPPPRRCRSPRPRCYRCRSPLSSQRRYRRRHPRSARRRKASPRSVPSTPRTRDGLPRHDSPRPERTARALAAPRAREGVEVPCTPWCVWSSPSSPPISQESRCAPRCSDTWCEAVTRPSRTAWSAAGSGSPRC